MFHLKCTRWFKKLEPGHDAGTKHLRLPQSDVTNETKEWEEHTEIEEMVEEKLKNTERLVKYAPKYECSPQCVISKYLVQIIELIKLFSCFITKSPLQLQPCCS
jgi:hypothetical protein